MLPLVHPLNFQNTKLGETMTDTVFVFNKFMKFFSVILFQSFWTTLYFSYAQASVELI